MADDVPPPSWGDEAVAASRRALGLSGLAAYEDSAVRHVLKLLGQPALASAIAAESLALTGSRGCTFAIFAELTGFPVQFGVARIRNTKFLAVPDLFDRWERTEIHRQLEELAASHPRGAAICLLFRYSGDADVPGPKDGRFMALHTACGGAAAGATRVVRRGTLAGRPAEITLETARSLLAGFSGWSAP